MKFIFENTLKSNVNLMISRVSYTLRCNILAETVLLAVYSKYNRYLF